MTKRPPPKRREPWPAFTLLAAILTGAALVCVGLLDFMGSRRGEPAYLFGPPPKAQVAPSAATAVPKPPVQTPGLEPSEKPAEKPKEAAAPRPTLKPFDEIIAASLAAAGVSDDSVLQLKGPKGRPLFEVELPSELYESV